MILVDAAVWIDLLRNRETMPVARLRKLLTIGEAAASSVIAQEVLQGATNAQAFSKLRKYFTGIPLLGARGWSNCTSQQQSSMLAPAGAESRREAHTIV